MATAETLQDLARSHIDVHAKGQGGNTKFTCNYCGKEYEHNCSAYDFIHSKAKFKQPEKFAEWVEETDEEQQEALLGLEGDEEFVMHMRCKTHKIVMLRRWGLNS